MGSIPVGVEEVVEEFCCGLTDNEISKVLLGYLCYGVYFSEASRGSNPIAKDLSSSEFWRN